MSLSIGMVIPSWHYWADPTRIQPMYELYYATVIEQQFSDDDVSLAMHDMRGIRRDQQVSHIPEHDLYLYWIMKAGDYTEITNLVQELRSVYPKARHVAGGVHIDVCAEDAITVFDAVVAGPGEGSFTTIIGELQNGGIEKKIYRMSYDDAAYHDYPFMRRHFLPESAIVKPVLFEKYGDNIRSTCVQFSRGCCYNCIYCVYNVPSAIQLRSPGQIEAEIDYLKKNYRIEAINLKDEIALPPAPDLCRPFLESIGNAGIKWRGQTTIWKADGEILALAGQSGCLELACGVESASPRVRKIIKKPVPDEAIERFIANCHVNGVKVKMCLIVGLPGEPENIVELTIKFIEKMAPDFVSISGFDPFPGSHVYAHQADYGIKSVDTDWGKHTHLLYRFSDEEEGGLPFEYATESPWGKTFSRKEIVHNIQQLQQYCREKKMVY